MSETRARRKAPAKAPVAAVDPAPGIRINNRVFADALARAAPFVGKGANIPILACVALRAEGGRLRVEANTTDLALRQSVPLTGGGVGEGCVDHEKLFAVARRLPPDEETTLEFVGGALVARCGAARTTITAWPLVDFPVFHVREQDGLTRRFSMKGETLAGMLHRVEYAISSEQTRFYLCGVCMAVKGEGEEAVLRVCATNGNDLAVAATKLPEGAAGMVEIIIPAAAAEELASLARGAAAVDLTVSDTAIVAVMGETVLLSKLIGAQYPDFDRVIPPPGANRLTVDGPALIKVVELAALFGVEEKRKPWVRLALKDGRVGVRGGEGTDRIVSELPPGAFTYDGAAMEISMTASALVEPARRATGRVTYHLATETPFLVTDEGDAGVIGVTGPLRG
jgi:DNA polymerase-3 subunit beta